MNIQLQFRAPRESLISVLVCSFVVALSCDLNAAIVSVSGSEGVDGVHGINGTDPSGDGGDGTAGGAAVAVADSAATLDADNQAEAYGGRGGHGGLGGLGHDFDDGFADGGDGGSGAPGGAATATAISNSVPAASVSAIASAYGGDGGNSGTLGMPGLAGGEPGTDGIAANAGPAQATASAVNSSGDVMVRTNALGGHGGVGFSGSEWGGAANGGDGASAIAVATGMTQLSNQSLNVEGTAHGGSGGNAFQAEGGVTGGAGGSATSSSTVIAHGDSSVWVVDWAAGGNGGGIVITDIGVGTGGPGGSASSTAFGSNAGSQFVFVRSQADAGQGGPGAGPGGLDGQTGDAVADATAIGASGQATSVANAQKSEFASVFASATAPLVETSHAQSRAAVGQAAPAPTLANGLQAASFATVLPTAADSLAALAGNDRVAHTFNVAGEGPGDLSTMFGLNVLGGSYGGSTAGSPETYSSTVSYWINLSTIPLDRLVVGLLNSTTSGIPDSISFRVGIEHEEVFALTVSSELASAYLSDQIIDLGDYAGVDDFLNIEFTLEVVASQPGSGFVTQFIFGNTSLAAPLEPDADFDDNEVVDVEDLLAWKTNYGDVDATHAKGDANFDNIVDGTDFLIWQRQVGMQFPPSHPSAISTPEPPTAALSLAALIAVSIAWQRRPSTSRR